MVIVSTIRGILYLLIVLSIIILCLEVLIRLSVVGLYRNAHLKKMYQILLLILCWITAHSIM
nr:MAG TPA: hypothetical protein [Caudoviricetes sp.]